MCFRKSSAYCRRSRACCRRDDRHDRGVACVAAGVARVIAEMIDMIEE